MEAQGVDYILIEGTVVHGLFGEKIARERIVHVR
jgi:hypothetical protein